MLTSLFSFWLRVLLPIYEFYDSFACVILSDLTWTDMISFTKQTLTTARLSIGLNSLWNDKYNLIMIRLLVNLFVLWKFHGTRRLRISELYIVRKWYATTGITEKYTICSKIRFLSNYKISLLTLSIKIKRATTSQEKFNCFKWL